MDTLLGVLWISGAVVWLRGGLSGENHNRVHCFPINCMTVVKTLFTTTKSGVFTEIFFQTQILQCVAMNVTLLYSLLAYSSIKQKDFSGVYVGQHKH